MRSKKIRNRVTSYIQPTEEPRTPKSAWGKYVYLAFLVLIIFVILQWGYTRLFYIDGVGFLESETTFVEARTPGRIITVNCAINDEVKSGQALVVLGNPVYGYNGEGNNGGIDWRKPADRRKMLEIEGELDEIKAQMQFARGKMSRLNQEHQRTRDLLAAGVVTYPVVLNLEEKLHQAEYELELLNAKFNKKLQVLQTFDPEFLFASENNKGKVVAGGNFESILRAPADGVVSFIFKQKGEVATIGEPVIRIVNNERVFVRTYFSGEFERSVRKNDEVMIRFENGEKMAGHIRKIYPTAFTQPVEIKKRFGSVNRYLIAEIQPEGDIAMDRVLETKVDVLLRRKWL